MKDAKKTTPLVAQAKVAQSKSMNVLLHLHVPEACAQERLEGIFSDTLAMRVIVTSSDVAINEQRDELNRSANDFLPRRTVPSNSNHTPESSAQYNDLASIVDGKSLKQIEQIVIEQVITNMGDSVPKAAKKLDVSPSTLYRKREAWAAE